MVSSALKNIDIHKIRDIFQKLKTIRIRMKNSKHSGFEWCLKDTTFYNQITLNYRDEYSTKSIKLFPNGSIQVAGCSDLFDCNRVIKQLSFILKATLDKTDDIPIDSFRIVMINSNFSLNYHVNLIEISNHFGKEPVFNVSFDPDRYSAVKIKFKPASDMKQVTVSIFSTGKIIVTGAETLKEIVFAYNIINQHIIGYIAKIKVMISENKDTFENILGYNIHEFLPFLKSKGFKPWVMAPQNYKINF
jgi:TATA-box binding protein (TBP) (component of TFIID and TFIIIB)